MDWRAIQKQCQRMQELYKGFQDLGEAADMFGQAEGELARLTAESGRLTTDIGQQRSTLEAIVTQIPQSRNTLDTLRGQIEGAEAKARAVSAKADDAERRVQSAQTVFAAQQESANIRITEARNALSQVQAEHRDLSADIVRLTAIRDQLKKSLAAV